MSDFNKFAAGRRIVAYGAGLALHQLTLTRPDFAPTVVVDDRPHYRGMKMYGATVSPLAEANLEPSRDCIVICAYEVLNVNRIRAKLADLGFDSTSVIDCAKLFWETMAARLQENLSLEVHPHLLETVLSFTRASQISNTTSAAGTSLLAQLALQQGEGDIAEFGVYQGGCALAVNLLLWDKLSRGDATYYLLDSFHGLQDPHSLDPQSRMGEFADADYVSVVRRFSDLPWVQIHRGLFRDTLPRIADRRFSVGYIDCDLYEPTVELLEFLRPRTTGAILVHDYTSPDWQYPEGQRPAFAGIATAVDDFVGRSGWKRLLFPETTHALLVPPPKES